jgi:hypothetical protein
MEVVKKKKKSSSTIPEIQEIQSRIELIPNDVDPEDGDLHLEQFVKADRCQDHVI